MPYSLPRQNFRCKDAKWNGSRFHDLNSQPFSRLPNPFGPQQGKTKKVAFTPYSSNKGMPKAVLLALASSKLRLNAIFLPSGQGNGLFAPGLIYKSQEQQH
jgi:hypothetical protein